MYIVARNLLFCDVLQELFIRYSRCVFIRAMRLTAVRQQRKSLCVSLRYHLSKRDRAIILLEYLTAMLIRYEHYRLLYEH